MTIIGVFSTAKLGFWIFYFNKVSSQMTTF